MFFYLTPSKWTNQSNNLLLLTRRCLESVFPKWNVKTNIAKVVCFWLCAFFTYDGIHGRQVKIICYKFLFFFNKISLEDLGHGLMAIWKDEKCGGDETWSVCEATILLLDLLRINSWWEIKFHVLGYHTLRATNTGITSTTTIQLNHFHFHLVLNESAWINSNIKDHIFLSISN